MLLALGLKLVAVEDPATCRTTPSGRFCRCHRHPCVWFQCAKAFRSGGSLQCARDWVDAVIIPPNTPYAGSKNGDAKVRVASTYIIEKGKPLASPA
jgi:hypothetical protein